jgi:hypothetical protein
MRFRTLIIFGVGYVWGARSGRDSYLELVERARGLLDSELVRDYANKIGLVGLQPADEATDQEEEDWDEEAGEEEAEDWDEEAGEEEAEPGEPEEDEETEPAEEPARSRGSTRRRSPSRRRG